ncbi:hypothetical protein [Nocardia sp. NPDC019304]|uniref:hypothetical protein n=1 Tax=unclassified Nocardia TaxID=2637762 RepID=UPI0033F1E460
MRQTDGRAITNPENAQSFSHAEIKQAADAMNPAALDGAFAAWSAIAAAVTNAGQRFEDAIKNAVEQHWEGAAADSAVRGVREYAARVGELGEAIGAQSLPLSAAADAAAKFKMSVPELLDASGATADPAQRNSREEQARDEMNTQYIQPYGATAPGIPTLPPPVAPAAAAPTGVQPGVGSGTGTSSETNPDPGTGTGVESGTSVDSQAVALTRSPDNSASGEPSATADTASPAGSADDGEPDSGVHPTAADTPETVPSQAVSSNQDTAATTPASITRTQTSTPYAPIVPSAPPPQTTPTTVTPTSFTGRPTGTPSRAGGAPGPAGIPTTSDNEARAGTSRPAQPTVPAAANGQPTAPGRPGATGAAGYSGMVPPGLRGRRTDDDEHDSPKYLRTEEHAKELLGEVKPTVPPVLGEQ